MLSPAVYPLSMSKVEAQRQDDALAGLKTPRGGPVITPKRSPRPDRNGASSMIVDLVAKVTVDDSELREVLARIQEGKEVLKATK